MLIYTLIFGVIFNAAGALLSDLYLYRVNDVELF